MTNPDDKKRWPLLLVIIITVITASLAIILVNRSTSYSFSNTLWGWLFGLPIGLIIGYFWNFLVLSLTLRHLPANTHSQSDIEYIIKNKRTSFVLLITFLGIIISEAYREFIWDIKLNEIALLVPAMSMQLQLVSLLVPMSMLGLVNFALAYSYLKLQQRQAMILAIIMAFFTAPWLLFTIPYIFGRVI